MIKRIIVLFLMVVTTAQLQAQVFGGNKPSLKFYQLNTDTVRVIFPAGLEVQAREVAWTLHHLSRSKPTSLGHQLRKFNLVMQNQTIQSNAYVGIAPYRSEFYMMPDLNNNTMGSIPWHLSLAIHEGRHMEQFSNFHRFVSKAAGVFFGQQGQAVAMNAAIPDWFWEGDAVLQETMSSNQGRGRLPDFFNSYRSLWLSGKQYSYMKLRNGSFRDFVPNHYDLGYLLVGYGHEKYGADFWKKVTTDAVDYKGLFYPMQSAIKKHSGEPFKRFVNNSLDFYKSQMNLTAGAAFNGMTPVTKQEKHNVQSYQYPFLTGDGTILALKSGYRQVPVWVRISKDGTEEKLRVKDIATDAYYSYKNDKVVYTAYEPDPRWRWKEYSVVKLWDIVSDEVRKISTKSRLFMPDLSDDGSTVVAVQYTTEQKSNLVLFSLTDSVEQKELPNSGQFIYTYPVFNQSGTAVISAVRNKKGEMALLETDTRNGQEQVLLPFSKALISYVRVYGDSVLFTSAQGETDVLMLYNRTTGELVQLSTLANGNYQASFDPASNTLLWNTFTSGGYMILKQKTDQLQKQKTTLTAPVLQYNNVKSFQSLPDIVSQVEQQPGTITRYKQFPRLFNIHSWRPTLYEPDYGITFISENIMNNLYAEYSYNYNRNESSHELGADLVYGGFYPQINAGISNTWNHTAVLSNLSTLNYNQTNAHIGLSVPLRFTSGTTYKFLTVSTSYNTEQLRLKDANKTVTNFNYMLSYFRFVNQSQKARQQIYPNWAQALTVQHKGKTTGVSGSQLFLSGALYFPGLLRNNHLVVMGSYQSRDTLDGRLFSNNFPFARGYNIINFPRMGKWSVNYHFPLVYPDAGFGNLVYLLRVRGNAFYDDAKGKSLRTGNVYHFRSAGMELYFDTRVWNSVEITIGVRYSRLLDTDLVDVNRNPNVFEVVLPLDLF